MSDALFDITPYGGPPKPKRAVVRKPAPETVGVSGERWKGVSKAQPGVVHLIARPNHVQLDMTGIMSACKILVVPHTFNAGEVRPGCAKCWNSPEALRSDR